MRCLAVPRRRARGYGAGVVPTRAGDHTDRAMLQTIRRRFAPSCRVMLPPLASLLVLGAGGPGSGVAAQSQSPTPGSAIFVHADGAGAAAWAATRLVRVGPDGELNWDRLPRVGVYRGHMSDVLGASSHGGATAHAFGVKPPYDSYGMRGTEPLRALSGEPHSVLREAHEAGFATALVNSGHIAEPGTGVFAASSPSRTETDLITREILESGTDIILAGGEVLMLPPGVRGRHGHPGLRADRLNLVDRARQLGYRVVYTRAELAALPDTTPRVLGLFAPGHTFNDHPEEALHAAGLPEYRADAPSVAEMTAAALRFLAARRSRFLLVVEEEGSDNFANVNNAAGTITALARADSAIGVAVAFAQQHRDVLVLTGADSEAGGPQIYPVQGPNAADKPLPPRTNNGAPLDGRGGTGTPPFLARADAAGQRHPFGIAWAARSDLGGGVVARAYGRNAELLPASVDNTDIYRMLYATLFGRWLP